MVKVLVGYGGMFQLTARQQLLIAGLQILGIFIAPLLALQLQKLIGNYKQPRERKLSIFKTLMATRGTRLSPAHGQELSMIAVELYGGGRKAQAILETWTY